MSRTLQLKRQRIHSSLGSCFFLLILSSVIVCLINAAAAAAATAAAADAANKKRSAVKNTKRLQDIENYRVYPVRSQDEAAVIEWGHSAIISALDAAVAHFGPQTAQAALLEVETTPVLAEPVNGVWTKEDVTEADVADAEGEEKEDAAEETSKPKKIRLLDNADEVHGNVVVMTDTGGVEGLDLALMAQASGAAALIVVHVDEDRPDDIYRLAVPVGREEEARSVDIPVVVVSLASANVLTTATVTADTPTDEIVNHGMPDRYVTTDTGRDTTNDAVRY